MSTLPSKEPHQGPLEVNAGHNQASPEVGACASGHKQASTSTRIKDTLIKSKKKLEDIMDKSFSHDIWRYGHLVAPNQPDSEDDENDPNLPLD